MSELHVVFGSGPLGRSVAEALLAQGKQVRIVNRSGQMDQAPAGVELRAGDLYDPGFVKEVTQSAAAAYQCAQPGYTEWPQKFPPLQEAIIGGMSRGSARLVIAENLYMYGDTDGQPMHEGMPYQAHTRKGQVRAAMSEAALAAHQAGKVQVALGRGSDFFGPWALGSSLGERVFYPALAGKSSSFVGRLDVSHTATYIKDFGRALAVLGQRDEALGRAWHVPNDRPRITQGEFAELIFGELGQPVKASAMGKFMLRLGGLFIPEARESVEMFYEFDRPFIVDSSQFEQTFGMATTPIQDAIRETVAWYRAHPQGGS